MKKEEFAAKLADYLEKQSAPGKVGTVNIDWGKWLAIIQAIIGALGPILTPPTVPQKTSNP
jgi:hypothetical protein